MNAHATHYNSFKKTTVKRFFENPARNTVCALCLFALGALLLFPARYITSVQNGLMLFATAVLPTMLPFFFLTAILNAFGFMHSLSLPFVKKVYNTSPIVASVAALSFLSGYPIGAILLRDLCRCGKITPTDAKRAISFCSTTSPLFIMGTLGAKMLDDSRAAAIILLAHYTAALINGLVWRKAKNSTTGFSVFSATNKETGNVLATAMNGATGALLSVCGFVSVFFMFVDICSDIGLFDILSTVFTPLFRLAGADDRTAIAFLHGLFEMTRGASELSACSCSDVLKNAAISFIISFGGLCVGSQSLSYCMDIGISVGHFVLTKITSAVISAALAAIFTLFVGWI